MSGVRPRGMVVRAPTHASCASSRLTASTPRCAAVSAARQSGRLPRESKPLTSARAARSVRSRGAVSAPSAMVHMSSNCCCWSWTTTPSRPSPCATFWASTPVGLGIKNRASMTAACAACLAEAKQCARRRGSNVPAGCAFSDASIRRSAALVATERCAVRASCKCHAKVAVRASTHALTKWPSPSRRSQQAARFARQASSSCDAAIVGIPPSQRSY
mmetsp:Transcript_32172/g.106451  ORF Transcript_32172/g.106451 Transcript_32172/m.106451 type:complete len:217 (-) Transcript_32172:308-958(-)